MPPDRRYRGRLPALQRARSRWAQPDPEDRRHRQGHARTSSRVAAAPPERLRIPSEGGH